ncbi:MAG: acetylglutamate kinase [Phycisphaerales bacterium]|nr:acetylglutamate kinase [Phycisphaerales bacterium]
MTPGAIDSSRGPIVVKLGGAAISTPRAGEAWPLGMAIAGLHRDAPAGVVVVHGGGAEVDAHLARLGMGVERRAGLRVTPPEQIEEVAGVLAGKVNRRLVAMLGACGAPGVGLFLGDGSNAPGGPSFVCEKHTPDGVDLGLVGRLAGGSGSVLRAILDAGLMPVLSSIGALPDGTLLNINADDAADGIARIVNASAIVLLTDVPGVLDADRRLIPELDASAIESLIASGVIAGGMAPKVRAALASATALGAPAVIASWKEPGSIAGLLRWDGPRPACTIVLPAAREPVRSAASRVATSPEDRA